tara:strand:+ start:1137 stop:1292 length:156 start_codon:yes stop_codon:yes gene_type:complete
MHEYKAVLEEASIRNKSYLETGHLYPESEFPLRPKWFKGSRDRGISGDMVA